MTHNDFIVESRFMFLEDNYWECWGCGRSNANCAHHIFGRGIAEGCEKSVLNFAPMNNHECHLPKHGHWCTDAGRKYLFEKTLRFLLGRKYRLTALDNEFLEKYKVQITRLNIKI